MEKMNYTRLKNTLIEDEGIKFKVYLDHLGFKTFGVGHRVVDYDKEYLEPIGTLVNPDRVWEVFDRDLAHFIHGTAKLFDDEWDQFPAIVKEILVNMAFNLGLYGLSKFVNFRAALARGDWREAAYHGRDSRWYTQVPNRAERLMSRLELVSNIT